MASLETLKSPKCAYTHFGGEGVPARFAVRETHGGIYGYCCNFHAERMLAEAQAVERHEITPRKEAAE